MESIAGDLYKTRQSGRDTISRQAFSVAIAFFTAVNIGVASLGAKLSYDWDLTSKSVSGWLVLFFFLACFAVSVGGAVLAQSSDDTMISVLGGCICAIAMGVMVGPYVSRYETSSVIEALIITTAVVLLTGLIGAIVPKDLSGWGPPLFAGLLGLIVISFALPLFGINHSVTLLDIVGIVLFCGIMMYDMNMAQRLDKTMNNAIDVAVNVFLNFANIFIRVLSLSGNKK